MVAWCPKLILFLQYNSMAQSALILLNHSYRNVFDNEKKS